MNRREDAVHVLNKRAVGFRDEEADGVVCVLREDPKHYDEHQDEAGEHKRRDALNTLLVVYGFREAHDNHRYDAAVAERQDGQCKYRDN